MKPDLMPQRGWVCPTCGGGVAPWIAQCPCIGQQYQWTFAGQNAFCTHPSWIEDTAGRLCSHCGKRLAPALDREGE